jgi:ubiquinone/menaquinone biosynthesis C-methylase UbiE
MGADNLQPVNHHADHPGFSGVVGFVTALALLFMGRPNARLAVDAVGVGPGDRVIDVGCGPGNAAREAARRGAQVTGVDPAPMMLALARTVSRGAPIDWVEGTAEKVPVPDGTATVVWSLATVHHWQDVEAGLREAQRVLTTGGRLLAIERQVEPGATGFASHGWTRQQAERFAEHCRDAGFIDGKISGRRAGRRSVWVVTARKP